MCVVQIDARYAGCDRVLRVIPTKRPLCQCGTMEMWSAHAVGNPSDDDRVAEHAYAADRCAREIVGFLKASPSALAATEPQAVGRAQGSAVTNARHGRVVKRDVLRSMDRRLDDWLEAHSSTITVERSFVSRTRTLSRSNAVREAITYTVAFG